MNKLILILLSAPTFLFAQQQVNIKGTTPQGTSGKVFFYDKQERMPRPFDSVTIATNGTFHKDLHPGIPGPKYIGINNEASWVFWQDNGDLEIVFDKEGFPHVRSLSGERGRLNNDVLNGLNQIILDHQKAMSGGTADSVRRNAVRNYRAALRALAEKNASVPAVISVLGYFDFEQDKAFIAGILSQLIVSHPENEAVKAFLAESTRLNPGQPATDFTYLKEDGSSGSLRAALTGSKYTLVDFWGTYCIPCREGIPGIRKLYDQYHSKGFGALAISLDTRDEIWKKSVHEENMPWLQGRTTDGGREVMSKYRFSGIPYLALFNQKAEIVALALQHEDLEQKLRELFGEPDSVSDAEEGTENRSIEKKEDEKLLIEKIISGDLVAKYAKILPGTTQEKYTGDYIKELNEHLTLKEYQRGKIFWSLPANYKELKDIYDSKSSVQEKQRAYRIVEEKQINFLRLALNKEQYENYLQLRAANKY